MSESTSTPIQIARLNERYAIANIGNLKRDTFVVEFGEDGAIYMRDFAAFRRHLYHEPAVTDGGGVVPLAEYWLKHPEARRYTALVFAPPGSTATVAEGAYNTWSALALEPSPGDWLMNHYHIRAVICGGNTDHERWLHNWIAGMLQRPGQHGWVAPVLKGGQGIGKGYFAHVQLGGMFRARNYAHLTNPQHLTGDFNSHLEDRVYVFADEAAWGDKKGVDRLKGLITEDTVMINRKHVPQEIQQSAMHILIASNAERPFPIERDDRRFFVLQVAEEFKQDQGYFEALHDELHSGGRAAMLDYFMAYDVDWDLLRLPPETDAKREMKAASLSPADEWWREVLDTADAQSWQGWQEKIGRALVVSRYTEWFDCFQGRGPKKSSSGLGVYFAKHFKAGGMLGWPQDSGKVPHHEGSRRRDNSWVFPVLAECRAVFDKATGTNNDWPADDHATCPP